MQLQLIPDVPGGAAGIKVQCALFGMYTGGGHIWVDIGALATCLNLEGSQSNGNDWFQHRVV
eukprot:5703759-Pyramimonas_sp.AAC.1